MFRPLLALVALACVLAPAAGAQDMATDAAPAYGTLRPTTAAASLDIVVRGVTDLMPDALNAFDCFGYIEPSAPDVVVEWGGGDLRIWTLADFDPTLAAYGPDGQWRCNDDTDGFLPVLEIAGAPAGRYAVWLGSFSPGPSEDAATLYAGPPPPPPALRGDAAPRAGRIAARGGFESAQGAIEVAVQAGGPDNAQALDLPEGTSCTGYVDAATPTAVVDYDAAGGTGTLALGATAFEDDLVLIVQHPDGRVECNDDFNGTDPLIPVEAPASGAYVAWVGTFRSSGGGVAATLTVAETAPEVIDDFHYDDMGGPYSEGSYTPLDLDTVPGPRATADDGGGNSVSVTVAPAAGNPVQGPSCTGFVEPTATAAVTLSGEGPFAVTATGDADLTLTLRTPSGGWFCSDDADGLNPGIQIDDAEDGLYLAWVGTFSDDGSATDATLSAAPGEVVYVGFMEDEVLHTTQSEGAYDGDALSTGPATLLLDLEGATASAHGVSAGGPVMNPVDGEVCAGFLPAAPTAAIADPEGGAMRIGASADDDLTLVVRTPDGVWICSDDADGSDPAIDVDGGPGTYEVWVGTFSRRDPPVPATLQVER